MRELAEEVLYQNHALRLIGLDSSVRIAEDVRQRSLRRYPLRAAFDAMIAAATAEGRSARGRLLAFVADLADRALATKGAALKSEFPPSVAAAIERAKRATTPLDAYRVLSDLRPELTEAVYQRLSALAESPPDERDLVLRYLVALASGRPELRVEASIELADRRADEGDYRTAAHYSRRAVALARALGSRSRTIALTCAYGTYLARSGRPEVAASVLEAAMASEDPADESGESDLLGTDLRLRLASVYRELGRLDDALPLIEQSLAIVGRLQGVLEVARRSGLATPPQAQLDQHECRLRMLRLSIHSDRGDWDLGEADAEAILVPAERSNLADMHFQAQTYRATAARARYDRRSAEQLYEAVVDRALRHGDPRMLAAAYNNLGAFYGADRAEESHRAHVAAVFHAGRVGFPNTGVPIALIGLGDAMSALGHRAGAITAYNRALESAEEIGEFTFVTAALTRLMQDDGWWADGGVTRMIELAPQLSAAATAETIALFGTTAADRLQRDGMTELALEMLRTAVNDIQARSPQSQHLADARLEYGRALADVPERRVEAYRMLAELVDDIERSIVATGDPTRKSDQISRAIDAYAVLVRLLVTEDAESLGHARPEERAFAVHEAAKARTFAARLGRATMDPPQSVPDELAAEEAELLGLARNALAEHLPGVSARERLGRIEVALRECWSRMREFAPDYARIRTGEPVSLAELGELLAAEPHRVALASFFCDRDSTTCFTLQPGEPLAVRRIDVGRSVWVDVAAVLRRQFNGAPDAWPPYPPIRRDRPWRRDLSALDRASADLGRLLEPVGDVDLLCVAPHGPLHLLPFAALRGEDGRYLIERFGVVHTPSLTTLRRRTGARPADVAAVVAGVAAEGDAHPEFFEHDEVSLGGIRALSVHNGPEHATPGSVLHALPNADVVHLTCHGFFDGDDPLRSGLLLADGERRPPRAPRDMGVRRRHRFLVTGEDVVALTLRASIVTLRACSSGVVGERNNGDEFDGLTRSFLQAGAGAVLAGLWNVDQRSSSRLTSAFYRHWLDGSDHPARWQALRRAQLELLHDAAEPYLAHPYHWAAMSLIGDWR
ncbi:CHAT domain-containing protein [Cryptosporangium minutisporangium]|uniref:CHAT domain-containing protein n=1 Tax=Cryptosporangium minutisporangium TaxID=113569 RepID=A0ABP6T234_9ACTN